MKNLETIEEEYLTDDTDLAKEDILKETWPIPQVNLIKDFEQYLLDISVRI